MSVFRIGTAAGGRLLTASGVRKPGTHDEFDIKQGEHTRLIYGLIKEQSYEEAKKILKSKLNVFPRSRAALSLIAYCCYHLDEFDEAAECYKTLCDLFPKKEDYLLSYCQSLQLSGQLDDAIKNAKRVCAISTDFDIKQQAFKVIMSCHYEKKQYGEAQRFRRMISVSHDSDSRAMKGSILYQQGEFEKSLLQFQKALQISPTPSIAYNMALCLYQLKRYKEAFEILVDIIDKGAEQFPDLQNRLLEVNLNESDENERKTSSLKDYTLSRRYHSSHKIENSTMLKRTSLIEAFNLKCAMHLMIGRKSEAKVTLDEMPPRKAKDLDAVTLHNQALVELDTNPTESFKKLKHLLANPPFPEVTFANLLISLCQYGRYSHAGDILADNAQFLDFLTPELHDFLDSVVLAQSSPEAGYKRLDEIGSHHVGRIREILKRIQSHRLSENSEGVKNSVRECFEAIGDYEPVLMHMSRIYWDIGHYPEVVRILEKNQEYAPQGGSWTMNIAHSLFMMGSEGGKKSEAFFLECIKYYEEIIKTVHVEKGKPFLSITPMVLANLCTAYVMTNQNKLAENILKQIEQEEQYGQARSSRRHQPPSLHLCIVNLVIGTLYCSKGHYDTGIERLMKSLDPMNEKLSPDTWYYVKRCMLGLAEAIAKHIVVIPDAFFEEILNFLMNAERYGKDMESKIDPNCVSGMDARSINRVGVYEEKKKPMTISREARILRMLFYRIRDDQ